ncbi:MAG TPA: hypothetical protein VGF55_20660 [Gemmataceae bacterium]|jgi:hypothetical protein
MSESDRNIPAIAPTPPGPPPADGQPRNPTVAYERTDVNTRAVVWFATALAGSIAVILAVLVGLYWMFYRDEEREKQSDFPVARDVRRQARTRDPGLLMPPSPRLEGIAPVSPEHIPGRMRPADDLEQHDVGRFRVGAAHLLYEEQERVLRSWAWADADHTAARIPIDEAMARLLAKPGDHLKARAADRASGRDELSEQPSRASSGRTPREGSK